jgi:putative aldouronate transport system permease protein
VVTKRSIGEYIFDSANIVLMILLTTIFIYPLLYCLFASFSDPAQLSLHQGPLIKPLGFSMEAYQQVLTNKLFVRGLFNTVFYVVVGTSLNVLLTAVAAFVLSRKKFYWKKPLMIYIVITMYFSGGLIPFYLVVKNLHLINSPLSIILPGAVSVFNLIIMRTYFLGIPDSLEESAVIDGANDFTVFFRIILPLSMPVVAVMIVYYGVGRWNEWFNAMIFLSDATWQPLQLLLRNILNQNDAAKFLKNVTDSGDAAAQARLIKYALIMITVFPILFVYPFVQKYFIKGVMVGSLKG